MSEPNTPETPETRQPESEDKLEPTALTENSEALKKLDNFWYHNKWTVIVVIFFAAVLIVCLVQILTRPKYDTSIVIATSYRMDNKEYAAFEQLLCDLMPEDFNDDGKKRVNIVIYQYYSPAEIEMEREQAEAESDNFSINPQYNNSELNSFTNYTMTGETSVCIVSPDVYARLVERGRLLPLSELYPEGDLPLGAREDGFGIDLSHSDLYLYNPAVAVLPESSVLCMLRPTITGNSSKKSVYEKEKTFFRALADFYVDGAGEATTEVTTPESAPETPAETPSESVFETVLDTAV